MIRQIFDKRIQIPGWIRTGAAVLSGIAAGLLAEVIREQYVFRKTSYFVPTSEGGPKGRIVFLSDLHCRVYGKNNEKLLDMIRNSTPELILVGGDMITSSQPHKVRRAIYFMQELVKIAPVYYAYGNHETRILERPEKYYLDIEDYLDELRGMGVVLLDNESFLTQIGGRNVKLTGFSLPGYYYCRNSHMEIRPEELYRKVGEKTDDYTILMAHNPAGYRAYEKWGADLILCGHYHGGVIRFGQYGLITPQMKFLAPRSYGCFTNRCRSLIVTGGLGTHTLPLRLFNPAEFVEITLG